MTNFNLFVYGTLMSDFRSPYHFQDDLDFSKATINGNLYHYTHFPMISIPSGNKGTIGSCNYAKDMEIQEDACKTKAPYAWDNSFGNVMGELYTLPFDENTIRRLDMYEGFNAQSPSKSLYNRYLVPVTTIYGNITWAWVYSATKIPRCCIPVPSGNWLDCFTQDLCDLKEEYQRR